MGSKGYIEELILRFIATDAEKIAFSLYDGERIKDINYRQFADDILKVSVFFRENGIRNQHIAVAAPNSYDWVVVFFAIIASGNIAVMFNQDLPVDILQWQCEKADVSMICSDKTYIAAWGTQFSNVSCVSFDNMKSAASLPVDMICSVELNETITMLFTSGTTGKSKAVENTTDNWRYSVESFKEQYAMKGMDRICIPVPFYHVLGLGNALSSLFYGKTICLGRGIKYLFMDMPVLNPALLIAVPSIVESLAKLLKKAKTMQMRQKYIGNNLQAIGYAGAVLKEPILHFMLELGLTMTVTYGMTECQGAATWCVVDEEHFKTAGKFTKYTQYRFLDNELLLKSPTLMKGYYKDPEETAQIIEDGWIRTGDLGYCDENGYFYLTGRKKNVIILSNGENVNPEEIEAKLGSCADILECLVYGDDKGICADVHTENREEVMAFILKYNEGSPLYRQIYRVNCSSTPLEKTGTGKIKRKGNI